MMHSLIAPKRRRISAQHGIERQSSAQSFRPGLEGHEQGSGIGGTAEVQQRQSTNGDPVRDTRRIGQDLVHFRMTARVRSCEAASGSCTATNM